MSQIICFLINMNKIYVNEYSRTSTKINNRILMYFIGKLH